MNAPLSAPPTRSQIERRRRLAEALQMEGSNTAPVGHWTQALGRALQGGVGGWQASKADEMEQGRGKALADALGGGRTPEDLMSLSAQYESPELMQAAEFSYNRGRDSVRDRQWQQNYDQDERKIAQAGSSNEFGLNPVWGEDEQGNQVLYQLGKAGGPPQQVQFPQGFKPQPGVQYLNTGTAFVPADKRTGQPTGQAIPIDNAGAAAQTAQGKASGDAVANLPKAEGTAQTMLDMISSVTDDPNRQLGTGWSSMGNVMPGTPGFDFQQKVNQLQGQSFLQAFESLKGGGQITQVEGEKATQAIARLSTAQSEDAFNTALTDLEVVVRRGLERARKQAGAPAQDGGQGGGNIPTYNPATGEFE